MTEFKSDENQIEGQRERITVYRLKEIGDLYVCLLFLYRFELPEFHFVVSLLSLSHSIYIYSGKIFPYRQDNVVFRKRERSTKALLESSSADVSHRLNVSARDTRQKRL